MIVGSKGKKRFKMPMAGPRTSMQDQMEQLQKQMAEAQNSLGETIVTGSAGGGAVLVEMTGTQDVRAITIKPEVVDPEDVEMLQDLILSALRDAQAKAQKLTTDLLGPLAGGMDLPGLL